LEDAQRENIQRKTVTCEVKGLPMRTLLLKTAAVAPLFTMLRVAAPFLHAQAPTTTEDAVFAVASVKPNTSGDQRVMIRNEPGGGLTVTNVPLRVLIRTAYQVQEDSQIVGAPSWIASDRFDIVAKAEGNPPPGVPGGAALGRTNVMLRALLKERFKLTAHTETRELPIYALVLARRDGRLGPRLRPTTVDCVAILAALFPAPGRGSGPPPPPSPPQSDKAPVCGSTGGPGRLISQGMTMARLAMNLSGRVNRVVVDRTGLVGEFDLDVEWTPDQFEGSGPLGPLPGTQPRPSSDSSGPSLYTAVQEQLGLELESTKGPVDVLIVDHVEQPTPN
jgi:uncharacterized protein (TIGR03435 family)